MAILHNLDKIKRIYLGGGERIKYVYYGNEKIWSDSHLITFVEGSVSTTVEYDDGATVSRSTAPSGATFVGWSKYSDGRSPVSSFVATEPGTWYRVVKFSNTTLALSNIDSDSLHHEYVRGSDASTMRVTKKINLGGAISLSSYSGVRVTLHSGLWYKNGVWGWGSNGWTQASIEFGGGSKTLGYAHADDNNSLFNDTTHDIYATSSSGNADIYAVLTSGGYGINGKITVSSVTLIGRDQGVG